MGMLHEIRKICRLALRTIRAEAPSQGTVQKKNSTEEEREDPLAVALRLGAAGGWGRAHARGVQAPTLVWAWSSGVGREASHAHFSHENEKAGQKQWCWAGVTGPV